MTAFDRSLGAAVDMGRDIDTARSMGGARDEPGGYGRGVCRRMRDTERRSPRMLASEQAVRSGRRITLLEGIC